MTQTNTTENITLYYRQGSSDKIYQAAIEPSGPGYVVNFAFGRRGSTLQTGTKTAEPVGLDEAKSIFHKLVKEKMTKGYAPGEDGVPYKHTQRADRSTGILPQLLNPIDEEHLQHLLDDPRFWMQEKYDGKRIIIRKEGSQVDGINRNGLIVGLPDSIVAAVNEMEAQNFLIDGEAMGDTYVAFDLLRLGQLDLRKHPLHRRVRLMIDLFETAASDNLRYADTAVGVDQKKKMLDQLRAARKEGVVFKRYEAEYIPGRPSSGGPWLKLKFYATASCIVAGKNGSRRSVRLELTKGNALVSVGNVAVPANCAIPEPGQVVEVRYLYAYPDGCLYQPLFLGARNDVAPNACTLNQLKIKAGCAESES